MSTRRLIMIPSVPFPIKKAFRLADEPICGEERLWRERAARMTLDALGHTNLTVKPHRHNDAVRYARRWFRGFFSYHPDAKYVDNVEATFECAGVDFEIIKKYVLQVDPKIFEFEEEEDTEDVPDTES